MVDPTAVFEQELAALRNGDGEWPDHVIPAAWWKERELLTDIWQWARARLIPPEILLVNVLAELAMRIPTVVVLPPIIGAPVALNFGGVIVAETGVGKTAGGRGLIHSATGETAHRRGMAVGLRRRHRRVPPRRRGTRIARSAGSDPRRRRPRPRGTDLPFRIHPRVNTVLGRVRRRDRPGQRRQETAPPCPCASYRLAVVLNIQPMYLRGVLSEVDGGLPQRFLFLSGTGHHLDDPDADDPRRNLVLPDIDVAMFTAKTGSAAPSSSPTPSAPRSATTTSSGSRPPTDGETVAGGSHRNLLRLPRRCEYWRRSAATSSPPNAEPTPTPASTPSPSPTTTGSRRPRRLALVRRRDPMAARHRPTIEVEHGGSLLGYATPISEPDGLVITGTSTTPWPNASAEPRTTLRLHQQPRHPSHDPTAPYTCAAPACTRCRWSTPPCGGRSPTCVIWQRAA